MLKTFLVSAFTLLLLAGCASTPVRDFRGDYQKTSSRWVRIDGHPPFNVAELRDRRRLKVELNILAQAFGGLVDPFVLLGVSNGIPPVGAHEAAARQYLAETGRSSCSIVDAAVLPNGREYEFRFSCR